MSSLESVRSSPAVGQSSLLLVGAPPRHNKRAECPAERCGAQELAAYGQKKPKMKMAETTKKTTKSIRSHKSVEFPPHLPSIVFTLRVYSDPVHSASAFAAAAKPGQEQQ